jgi:hypothetical protein
MIECPVCKIQFSPRHHICPICKSYQAKLYDRIEYLADKAEQALDRSIAPINVEAMLVDEGISPLEAAEIVRARARKVTRAARSYGLFRLIGGSTILLVAIFLALVGVFLPGPLAFRLLVLASFAAAAGTAPFLLGLYSVVTGREKQ